MALLPVDYLERPCSDQMSRVQGENFLVLPRKCYYQATNISTRSLFLKNQAGTFYLPVVYGMLHKKAYNSLAARLRAT